MRITPDLLLAVMPRCRRDRAEQFAEPFTVTLREHDISTPRRAAHFCAQVGHESASLRYLEENLNYSQEGLQRVFPRYFTLREAARYARQPERIANRVYANRMGNGPETSGDGWRHRGFGPMQLTGHDNQYQYGWERKAFLADMLGKEWPMQGFDAYWEDPSIIARDPRIGADTCGWYWTIRGLNKWADRDDARRITKLINGGYNGLDDRLKRLEIAKNALGVL